MNMSPKIVNPIFKGKYWQYQLLGWFIYLMNEISSAWNRISISYVFSLRFFTTFAVLYALLELVHLFYRRIYKSKYNPAIYLIIAVFTSFICSLFWREIRTILDIIVFKTESTWWFYPRDLNYLSGVISGTWVPFVWSILYFGIKYWQDFVAEKQRANDAVVMAQNAQLQMLRYQLNPHFLFNSLNSIQALVHENPDQADSMVSELSEFLRFTLKYNDKIMISVKEEVDITHKYLTIEKIRFEERLDFMVHTDEKALKVEIPCFITQPLVENSIKHGLFNNPDGIKLKFNVFIEHSKLVLEVANSGKLEQGWRMGVGLQNVFDRLENSYPGRFSFILDEQDGFVIARILITLKHEKISITNH